MRRWEGLAGLMLAVACAAPTPRRPAPPPRPSDAPPLAQDVVRTARAYLPEEDGGRAVPRSAADFVRVVYAENGIKVPPTVAEQSLIGVRVESAELRAGDLLFFSGERISRIAEHVGLYMQKGLFAHYRPGYGVMVERLDSPYYRPRFVTARRLIL
jgi:hypothetical protein